MEQPCFVHVAVVFDTPYPDYSQDDHFDRMAEELKRGRKVEAEMEYQVAGALRDKGHKVSLVGVHADLSPATTSKNTSISINGKNVTEIIPSMNKSLIRWLHRGRLKRAAPISIVYF